MAGNIMKWWKHKILGGYKQFSVLQECTTDSEELIYPVRAPSSCSAPPDLLMVSDRETVQLKQSVNIISTSKGHHHHHHSHHNQPQQHQNQPPHQQQQQQSQYSQHSQNHQSVHHHHNQQKDHHSKKATATAAAALVNKNHESPLIDIESGELNGGSGGGGGKNGIDERIRLEEFTCDVSVESGKSSQPLQFSFTFYDLDGHHGKITKDDIAGIVYTIYESIGKSVVVPYCGSKTINVRLTVSPEAKSKSSSSKLKKLSTTVGVGDGGGGNDVGCGGGGSAPPTGRHQSSSAQRRQHRYRPRKLIKSDEEEDDAESDSEKDMVKKSSGNSKSHHNHLESKLCCTDDMTKQHSAAHQQPSTSCKFQPLNITENIYESVSNLKFNGRETSRKDEAMLECKECVQSTLAEAVQRHHQQQQQAKHILTRSKLLRRTRKHKDQCVEARQRSLSVGNESSWKIRGVHITKNVNATSNLTTAAGAASTTASTTNATGVPTMVDEVDGASPNQGEGGGSNSPNNECWNNALKRNDLIDIIRASMEKNRLCFQGSGKPHHQQNGVSPVRHRQRSHTISKIVNDTSGADIYHQHQSHHHQQQQQQQHTQHQQQQTSHHIPIYHQQMAINPAILMSHPKTNLCGYDSFLHATICTPLNPSANNSPNSVLVPNQQQQHHHMVSSPTATVPPATKAFINSMKQQHQRSSSKAMRNGGGGMGYHSQQNSPQFHGAYLMEPQKLNSSLLNALNPQITAERKLIRTIDNVEKWLNEKGHLKCSSAMKYDEGKQKKDEKNYDNLLYSKLNEKFLDVSTAAVVSSKKILNNNNSNNNNSSSSSHHPNSHNNAMSSNKENERHHHHSHHHNHLQRHSKYNMRSQSGSVSPLGGASSTTTATTAIDRSKFAPLIPIDVDPIECENLIHSTTSDEDSSSLTPAMPTKDSACETKVVNSGRSSNYTAKNSSNRDDTINGGVSSSSSGSCSGASNNGNNSTASTVHRYVHEHIHHHYHHFENNEE